MKTKIILSFAFLIAFVSSNLFSQGLNSVYTPDGVYVIAVGNAGKIYRSTNSGNTWSSYTYLASNLKSVTAYGNDVWIGTEAGNVYKTSKTHSPLNVYNAGGSFTINSVCFVDNNNGFLCGDAGNVYKSVNGGVNWTPINTGVANVTLNHVSFLDNSKGVVVGNNGTIYVTENGGTTWTPQTSGTTKNLLKAKYFTDGIIVVGEYGTILTRPTTGTWNSVITRTDSDIRGVTGSSMNNARVCGGGGFIRNNLGSSANFFNFEINPMMANLVDIFYYNANVGFAVSSLNYAIIRTTNGGASWELPSGSSVAMNWVSKTPSGSGIGNNLCMHPKDRNSAFVVYGNKVYVSRDRSETWTQIATISVGSRAHSFYVSPVDTNIMMAAMESSPDCVVRSTNYGATWTNIIAYDFSTYGQPLEMDQNNPSTFYFAPSNSGGTGLYRSTDNGATFSLMAPYNNSSINQPCDIIIEWDNPSSIYLGDDGADIFKSTNSGLTWELVKTGTSSEVPSMCNTVFDKTLCYATTWSSSQVWKTVNSGNNWNVASNNSGSGWGSDMCHEDPTLVLTGNYGSQSYLSTNNGVSFSTISAGLSGAGAGIMVPERGYLLNMQTGNLFKLSIVYSVITSANENTISSIIPSNYELSQNYPNPFNPVTNIRFALPNSGNISLKVYDQLGKEVSTLSEGFRAAGTYEINFDASSLTSGVYFYKLITSDVSFTKKMLLVK